MVQSLYSSPCRLNYRADVVKGKRLNTQHTLTNTNLSKLSAYSVSLTFFFKWEHAICIHMGGENDDIET